MQMTEEEIYSGLLDPYFLNPSLCSVDAEGNLKYRGPGGRKCAFAMACKDEVQLIEGKLACENLEELGIDILKDVFRHVDDSLFWDSLQMAHDSLAGGDTECAHESYLCRTGRLPPKTKNLELSLAQTHEGTAQ